MIAVKRPAGLPDAERAIPLATAAKYGPTSRST